ncbi:putative hydroxypyruvate isomerase [Xenia sp. Carnegie-2017]|uniref:putative hydroxypyruvate isomerase n=1 Tax=Xenia sp. Carnegie-2017 TaxID=2897299 RepID=UPI001F03A5D9|nr:putative hydroxypyruvate isomerase [Xenia sp. Carnegie-2017]
MDNGKRLYGLRVDANISFMFTEWENFIDRYSAASNAGFKGVESGDEIYQYSIEEIAKAKSEANVRQIVIVSFGGPIKALTAIPGRENEFYQTFQKTLKYALALNCDRVHVCSGLMANLNDYSKYEEIYLKNLRYCSGEAKKVGIHILIEPISTIPGYFLNNTNQAIEILKKLNCSNVKLEFDFFHAQRTHGNMTKTLRENIHHIGHIQVSQVPKRDEPSNSGEINYNYIFRLLLDLKYDQWIGCEYNPQGDTIHGLQWITDYGLTF